MIMIICSETNSMRYCVLPKSGNEITNYKTVSENNYLTVTNLNVNILQPQQRVQKLMYQAKSITLRTITLQ